MREIIRRYAHLASAAVGVDRESAFAVREVAHERKFVAGFIAGLCFDDLAPFLPFVAFDVVVDRQVIDVVALVIPFRLVSALAGYFHAFGQAVRISELYH